MNKECFWVETPTKDMWKLCYKLIKETNSFNINTQMGKRYFPDSIGIRDGKFKYNILDIDRKDEVTFNEFKKRLKNYSTRSVVLNSENTATIYDDHVEVGCQTFSFDVIKELARKIEKVETG